MIGGMMIGRMVMGGLVRWTRWMAIGFGMVHLSMIAILIIHSLFLCATTTGWHTMQLFPWVMCLCAIAVWWKFKEKLISQKYRCPINMTLSNEADVVFFYLFYCRSLLRCTRLSLRLLSLFTRLLLFHLMRWCRLCVNASICMY